jgi:branched-chain amino acid transport system ATP-binding protein
MEALKVEGLSKHFGGLKVLQDISFMVEMGETIAIIGPNGAGKTTLLNLLTGQLFATAGRISLFGKEITNMVAHRRAHLGLARSFQVNTLFFNLTVLENVLFALQGTKPGRYQMFRYISTNNPLFTKAHELLNSLDLWEKKDETAQALSYGEQRRLEITLALALEPRVLLLDEPSAGLTADESVDVIDIINNLGSNIAVLIVAHDMDLVFGVANRIIVLHYGQIMAEGMPEEIQVHPKVRQIYLGEEETRNATAN